VTNEDMAIHRDSGQPMPVECNVTTHGGITAIARRWNPGDARRCRLCPVCTAGETICVVQTARSVRDEDAWLYVWRGPPGHVAATPAIRLAQ
jgi:hypothetical protein